MEHDENIAELLIDALGKIADIALTDAGSRDATYEGFTPRDYFVRETDSDPLAPAGFGIIRQDDAEFDQDAFYARVDETFLGVHQAMDAGKLDTVRHVMQSDVFNALRERAGAPTGPLTIVRRQALAIVRDGGQDHIRIRIVAETADGDIVQEYWSFARDVGARSKAGASLFRCPNCGGPIDGDDRVRCSYCGVQLCDPALDWVVDRIAVDA
jgi:hypothetical protein